MIDIVSCVCLGSVWLAIAIAYSARNDIRAAQRERDDYYAKWREAEHARRDEMRTNHDLRILVDQLRNGAPYR